jgi:50S ribosomal subunit-associated GTPase HflX
VVVTKTDLLPSDHDLPELQVPKAWGVFLVSSVTREGLSPLLESLYTQTRKEAEKAALEEDEDTWWVPE